MLANWGTLQQLLARVVRPDPDVTIRPRLKLPFLLVGLLLIPAILTPDRVWSTLLIGLVSLIVLAFVWARQLAVGLSATRRLRYGWVSVGDRLQEDFVLGNRSALPALWVAIADSSTVPGYEAGVAQSVGGNDRVRWSKTAVCSRRGHYRLGPWALRSGDPFGLFEVVRAYGQSDDIIIHPPVTSRLAVPLPPGQSEGRARSVAKAWQATINAAGVRNYQPLDPTNWIHWKTSAKRDELFVRRFERDAAGDLWVLVDCHAAVQLGSGPEGTEEKAVLLAAAISSRALADGRPVGFAAYGLEPLVLPPALGQAQSWAVLRALALMTADGDIALPRALLDLAKTSRRGSAAVIITSTDSASLLPGLLTLGQQGIESHVLLLDRASFGAAVETANSDGLYRTVLAAGYRCQLLDRASIGQPDPEGERHGFWEFKVSATGKAVAVRRPTD